MMPITPFPRSHPPIDPQQGHPPVRMPHWVTILAMVTSLIGFSIPKAIALETAQVTAQVTSTPPVPTETVTLGRSPSDHYVVIIPVSNLDRQTPSLTSPSFQLLQRIRTIVPQAFLARHSLGDYIYVGGFTKFGPAHQQVEQIRTYAVNARVVYFR